MTSKTGASAAPNSQAEATPQLHKLIRTKLYQLAIRRAEQFPNEVNITDDNGDLPLIVALQASSTPLALIETLLSVYPYKRVVQDLIRQGQCRRVWSNDFVMVIQSATEKQQREKNTTRVSGPPLVLAVQNKLSRSIVRHLMTQAGLDGLRVETNSHCQLPLHVAAGCDSLEVVQLLTTSDLVPSPLLAAAATPDVNGQLPLHCFVQARAKQASLELLLSTYPNALTHQDHDGRLALHLALQENASLVMIQCLVASYPKSVRVEDRNGNLPIHYAFVKGARTFNLGKKLQALLKVYPRCAQHKNKQGLTPSMLAAETRRQGYYSSMDYNLEAPIQELLAASGVAEQQDNVEDDDTQQEKMPPRKRRCPDNSFSPLPSLHATLNTCCVCLEGQLSHALVPCGHVVLCHDCADMDCLVRLDGCCPIQRCRFFRAQKVIGSPMDQQPCVICLEGTRSHAVVPCGHVLLCQECANDDCLTKLGGACPIGRCRIRSFLKIGWP